MICQWQNALNVLPGWMKHSVDELGKGKMQELRLRLGQNPRLCFQNEQLELERAITKEDISFIINTATRYSPWAYATTAKGYITIPGGHRLGLGGDVVVCFYIQKGNFIALFFQFAQGVQHSVMFKSSGNDMFFVFPCAVAGSRNDGLFVSLAAAGGEIDLTGLTA